MRVAYICADPGIPVFGCKGASIHVQEVVRALVRRGAEVVLFAARFGGEPPTDLHQVECRALPLPKADNMAAREQAAVAANAALVEAVNTEGRFDLIYERYSLWSHAGMEWAAALGIPGVLEVNAPLIDEQEKHRSLHDRKTAEAIARRVFGAAQAVIAVSSGVAAYVRQQGGINVHVTPNGVDPARFDPTQFDLVPKQDARFTVGFVGTLKPWHDLPIFVEASKIARHRGLDINLLIVGDGPERALLEAKIAQAGLSGATVFTGAVQPADIPALIALMDVAVAPYPTMTDFYFSPLKVMEYMAAGRAIVASRIGDMSCLLSEGETGLFVPPGDPRALADAMLRLHRDPDLRASLGKNARIAAKDKHSWSGVVDKILWLANMPKRNMA